VTVLSGGVLDARVVPVGPAPVLAARALSVGYGGQAVLGDIDLTIAAGERVAVLGRNGSGKSTLLRALAGVAPPLGGQLRWSGAPLPSGPGRVRQVGVLFQGEPRAPFTVRELVTLGLALDAPPSLAARRLVDAALVRFGLRELAERPCPSLSGGEWQRAALARALVAEPRLLVLDEPVAHLDLGWRADLAAALERLRGVVAVVMATHDLDAAAACDRVLLLSDGRASCQPPRQALTPAALARALGIRVQRHDPADGGPPLYRVLGRAEGAA